MYENADHDQLNQLAGIVFESLALTMALEIDKTKFFQNIFPATDWQDFFINSQSWLSAAQEAFLTWALFGASIISIFSKTTHLQEKKTALRRDALIVVVITISGLILAAVLGNACVQILIDYGFYYFPGSYGKTTNCTPPNPMSFNPPRKIFHRKHQFLCVPSSIECSSTISTDCNSIEMASTVFDSVG